jgi:drug/metabolite transporter (DMT)-like permease
VTETKPRGTAEASAPASRPDDHFVPIVASLAALAAGVVWSLGAINARLADESDAFQYLIWRSAAIVLVVEAIARVRRRPAQTPIAFTGGRLMLVACAALLLASIAFVYAVKNTAPANAAFLGSITPLFAALLGRPLLGEVLTPVTIAAVTIALVGLGVTVAGDLEGGNLDGNLAAIAAAAGFAGYTICVRSDVSRDWSPVLPGYGVMMIVLCVGLCLVGGTTPFPPPGDIALAALHGGVFVVAGTLLFNHASRRVPAVPMAILAQSEMIFVPLWAFLILSDVPTTTSLIGGAIIAAAALGKAVLDARRRPPVHPSPDEVPVPGI